jgi:type I site-specific restriction-modification system R (restriction) subunit
VLRRGIKHGRHDVDLFYGTPSAGNADAAARYAANRFSVTRQLRYSRDETQLALDLGLFINGLPVATFEIKNSLTKQTVEDAVQQYQRDRDPRERLFEFGRCVVHFAVDDHEVRFCTHLKGKGLWFLPFNLGWNDGAGNARQHSDRENARVEHDKALGRVMTGLIKDDTELFRQFTDNDSFRRWLTDTIFRMTYSEQQPTP